MILSDVPFINHSYGAIKMAVQNISISGGLIILDSVTFAVNFSDKGAISIQSHPSGPCFVCGAARAVLSEAQANILIQAGVTDLR